MVGFALNYPGWERRRALGRLRPGTPALEKGLYFHDSRWRDRTQAWGVLCGGGECVVGGNDSGEEVGVMGGSYFQLQRGVVSLYGRY